MKLLPDIKDIKPEINIIENKFIKKKNISLSILRLDKIHPNISGNKYFKLYYFLQKALLLKKKIITFGGAYSNHLAATAKACNISQIECIGIIRGERAKNISHTLSFCEEQGMKLQFINREEYKKKDTEYFKLELSENFGEHILIPEGGYSKDGVNGSGLIANFYNHHNFSHICTPVGTATTLAGLINVSLPSQKIIGFNILKNITDINYRLKFLLDHNHTNNYYLIDDYHFGGYAKKTNELIAFMNRFYDEFSIPTDFVYTGKMMFGVLDMINKNYFSAGSNILCIHTGGLQGNQSLKKGILNF